MWPALAIAAASILNSIRQDKASARGGRTNNNLGNILNAASSAMSIAGTDARTAGSHDSYMTSDVMTGSKPYLGDNLA